MQCFNRGTGGERPWIRNRVGAGGQMARSGGAQETWWLVKSTVSAICIVAETVQESLWKSPRPPAPAPAPAVVEGL